MPSGVGVEIPLQPVQTMSRQAVSLQPLEVHDKLQLCQLLTSGNSLALRAVSSKDGSYKRVG